MDIPVYRAVVGKGYLEFVSLVDKPAIIEKGLAFTAHTLKGVVNRFIDEYFSATPEKQVIVGPAMIPGVLIGRVDKEIGEYAIVFDRESIEWFQEQFAQTRKEHKINFDHDGLVESAFVKSEWIIEDAKNDKSKMYGFNYPEGTWMMEIKVNDKEFWNKRVKEEGRYGFSVEGLFELEMTGETVEKNKLLKMSKVKTKLEELLEEVKALSGEDQKAILDIISEATDTPVEDIEVKVELPETEDKPEEVKEELAVEPVLEPVLEPVIEPVDIEAKINEVVKPLLDEIYAMIAELKGKEEVVEEVETPAEFSRVEKMMASFTGLSKLNFD
jgi:hypothetical protein